EIVIVIRELDRELFAGLPRPIESLGRTLPAIRFATQLRVDPGADDMALPENLRRLQYLWQSVIERVIADVGRRRGEPMANQQRPHRVRRPTEQVDELHF